MDNTVGRQFYLSDFQKEVIIGSLLGDARLESRSNGRTARLRIHQGDEQKDFAFWKYSVLKHLVSAPPRKIVCRYDIEDDRKYYSWYFHTLTFQEFGKMHRDFYTKERKILPSNIEKILTPVSLAVWIMDDGCFDKGALILNSHNFSIDEQERLQDILKNKFDLTARMNKDRARYRLRIRKKDTQKIRDIVNPFIIPSMMYKIVPVTTS